MNKLSTEHRLGAETKTFTRKPISLLVDYLNILKGKRTSYWHSPKGLELVMLLTRRRALSLWDFYRGWWKCKRFPRGGKMACLSRLPWLWGWNLRETWFWSNSALALPRAFGALSKCSLWYYRIQQSEGDIWSGIFRIESKSSESRDLWNERSSLSLDAGQCFNIPNLSPSYYPLILFTLAQPLEVQRTP